MCKHTGVYRRELAGAKPETVASLGLQEPGQRAQDRGALGNVSEARPGSLGRSGVTTWRQ